MPAPEVPDAVSPSPVAQERVSQESPAAAPSLEPPKAEFAWLGPYYALRTGVAAGVATAAWQLLHLDHGWWIAISAVVVVQPDRGATTAKSVNRVLGTLIGGLTATAAALFLPFDPLTAAVVVSVTILFGWWIPALREPLPLAAITALLVFTLDTQDHSLSAGAWRAIEIAAGVLIGLAVATIRLPGEPPLGGK
jgi:uncharacterized membrane protein YccC